MSEVVLEPADVRLLREALDEYARLDRSVGVRYGGDPEKSVGESDERAAMLLDRLRAGDRVAAGFEDLQRLVWVLDLLAAVTQDAAPESPGRRLASRLKIACTRVFGTPAYGVDPRA